MATKKKKKTGALHKRKKMKQPTDVTKDPWRHIGEAKGQK